MEAPRPVRTQAISFSIGEPDVFIRIYVHLSDGHGSALPSTAAAACVVCLTLSLIRLPILMIMVDRWFWHGGQLIVAL